MSTRARWGSTLGLAMAAMGLFPVALRPPRLTLLNAALRVDYGWAVVAAAVSSAVLLAAAGFAAPPLWVRRVGVLAALLSRGPAGDETLAGAGGPTKLPARRGNDGRKRLAAL